MVILTGQRQGGVRPRQQMGRIETECLPGGPLRFGPGLAAQQSHGEVVKSTALNFVAIHCFSQHLLRSSILSQGQQGHAKIDTCVWQLGIQFQGTGEHSPANSQVICFEVSFQISQPG